MILPSLKIVVFWSLEFSYCGLFSSHSNLFPGGQWENTHTRISHSRELEGGCRISSLASQICDILFQNAEDLAGFPDPTQSLDFLLFWSSGRAVLLGTFCCNHNKFPETAVGKHTSGTLTIWNQWVDVEYSSPASQKGDHSFCRMLGIKPVFMNLPSL